MLTWDKTTPHHIGRGDLAVRIETTMPEDEIVALAHDAREHCPVCNVLKATADVTLTVLVTASGPSG
jgi:uncharacterized OsmC-like protein